MDDKIKQKTIEMIAERLGVDPEDVKEGDSLKDDLKMTANEINDLIEEMREKGIEISADTSELETVEDIIDAQNPEEFTT